MKYIYILICLGFLGCGPIVPFVGKVPSGIISVEKTKKEIINDTEAFIGITFKSAKSVIEVNNGDVIIGKATSYVDSKYSWSYTFSVRAKDGKVRYQFDNIILNSRYDFTKDDYIINKRLWSRARTIVNEEMDLMAKKYEMYIKQNHNDF